MYVIRPNWNHKTSRLLAKELGVETRRWPNRIKRFRPEWRRDFFLYYPDGVSNADDKYKMLQAFFWQHKGAQRRSLADMGLPVPETMPTVEGQKYVIRPLHHKGGMDFRLSEVPDGGPGTYAAPLFPKTHEYRLIFVRGKPVVFMRKHPREGTRQDEPWNAINAPFKTIHDWPASRLQTRTSCFHDLTTNIVVAAADLLAVDVLYNKDSLLYVVCEFNSCPGLDIVGNRAKIVAAIRGVEAQEGEEAIRDA